MAAGGKRCHRLRRWGRSSAGARMQRATTRGGKATGRVASRADGWGMPRRRAGRGSRTERLSASRRGGMHYGRVRRA